jgi:hypothetical protein
VNNPPTQLTPILNASDNPYNTTDATLTCYNQSTSDADGDPVNNSYGWFRNSTLVSGLTTNSVNAGNTTEGETWKCKITPYDGTDNGTAKNSSALTINQLPNTLLVKINSSSGTNYSNENLTCYANATGFATNITLYYRVLNGSMLYASGSKSVIKNTLSSITTINSSALSGGQVWKCSVKASYNGVINESEWNNASLTVITAPYCDDSSCNDNENCSTCAADCGSCPVLPYCGDSSCNGAENCSTCNADCGTCPIIPSCGDGSCNGNENCSSCNIDCGNCPVVPICGDSVCNGAENCSTCSQDCGSCPVIEYCGDGICNNNENCSSCSADCGNCPIVPYCGDGACDNNENCSTCIADCGACPVIPFCGDETCNGNENCSTCSNDCGNCTITPYCGDGTCNNNESCSTCAADCGTCPEIQTPSRGGSGGSSRSTTNKNITNISSGRQGETKISTKEGTTKVKQETGEEETEGQVVEEPNQEIPGNIDIGSQNDIASAPKGILIILAILTLIGLASVAKEAYPDLKKALKSTGSSETGSKAKDLSITYQEENNIEDLAKLHHYVKEAAKQGYTREKVRSELSGVGWEREIIEPLLLMHEPEFLPPLLPEPPVIQSLDAQKQPKEAYMLNPVKKWLEFERIDYKEESEHEDKGGLR